jgi:hypothetical protein
MDEFIEDDDGEYDEEFKKAMEDEISDDDDEDGFDQLKSKSSNKSKRFSFKRYSIFKIKIKN